jgi:hypothetical protein
MQNRIVNTKYSTMLTVLLTLILTQSALSAILGWHVISSGGGTGSSASYTLGGTVGQTAVGVGSSDSYVLNHGFWQEFGPTICCIGIRGNVNGDGGDAINVADVTYLVAFLKGLGPESPCFEEADVNGSGSINVVDVTYLVAYLKGLGPAPAACGSAAGAPAAGKVRNDMSLNTSCENGMTLISLESSVGVRGIQIELAGTQTGEPVKLIDDRMELSVNQMTDGTTRVLILDLEGDALIDKGVQALVRLPGEFKIVEAVIADFENHEITPAINATAKNTNLPDRFVLYQNHPNPFNPTTEISFDLPNAANAKLEIYNIMGQQVATIVDRHMEAGRHSVTWNSTNDQGDRVASGIYFYRLDAGDLVDTKKMILLK